MLGKFALLSSNSSSPTDDEKTDRVDGSEDLSERKELQYNIMLISWNEDSKIAYRVAWTAISKSAWEECETVLKRIVLG
jgi:hypothetical protein